MSKASSTDWIDYKPDVAPVHPDPRGLPAASSAPASALWSGDVASRWDDLRDQISAGVNFSMAGHSQLDPRHRRLRERGPLHASRIRRTSTSGASSTPRWFQFGAFSPLFRSHGESPKREIYELAPEGSPTYDSLAWIYDRLRYRLMPYIYTIAADTYHRDGTIMRGLVMDFPADRKAWGINDQYLFGPAFLVAPVTEFKARSREVYLPAGTLWYDFYSGRS